jgi:hypothetical protein
MMAAKAASRSRTESAQCPKPGAEVASSGSVKALELLDSPARALPGDGPQARGLVLAVAASAHGHAVFLLEGMLADQPDPLTQAGQKAASAAKALTVAYDQ